MSAPRVPGSPPPGAQIPGRPMAVAPSAMPGAPSVGMAQMPGHQVEGPMGPKKITEQNIAGAAALAEAMREAAETPPAEPPAIPAEQAPAVPDAVDEAMSKTDLYEEIQNRLQQGGQVHDPALALALAYMDSKDRRSKVEARLLTKLEYSTYALRREFRQTIKIWPDDKAPEVELRSMTGADLLCIREILSQPQYLNPLVGEMTSPYLTAAVGLVRIGEDVLPELPRKIKLEDRKKLILERLDRVIEEPHDVIWDLYVNHLWFQARCRRVLYGSDATF